MGARPEELSGAIPLVVGSFFYIAVLVGFAASDDPSGRLPPLVFYLLLSIPGVALGVWGWRIMRRICQSTRILLDDDGVQICKTLSSVTRRTKLDGRGLDVYFTGFGTRKRADWRGPHIEMRSRGQAVAVAEFRADSMSDEMYWLAGLVRDHSLEHWNNDPRREI